MYFIIFSQERQFYISLAKLIKLQTCSIKSGMVHELSPLSVFGGQWHITWGGGADLIEHHGKGDCQISLWG
jgi:hypothetical protein